MLGWAHVARYYGIESNGGFKNGSIRQCSLIFGMEHTLYYQVLFLSRKIVEEKIIYKLGFKCERIKISYILLFTGMFLLIFTCALQIWSLQKLSVPGLAAVRNSFLFWCCVMLWLACTLFIVYFSPFCVWICICLAWRAYLTFWNLFVSETERRELLLVIPCCIINYVYTSHVNLHIMRQCLKSWE